MSDPHVSGRPEAGEFAEYATADIAHVAGDDAVAALQSQAGEFLAFLSSLDDEAVRGLRYAPRKWTVKEVIGHMIDDERILAYRALCIARFDLRPLAGFDENEYVAASRFEGRTLASLAAEYRAVRQATVALFETMTPDEWRRRGIANDFAVSVRGIAFHLAGHELHHLRALREKYLPART